MTIENKNIKFFQIFLIFAGIILIYITYISFKNESVEKILSEETKSVIDDKLLKNQDDSQNIFFNIEYSGIDLAGNRYILKAKEAVNEKTSSEILNLKLVTSIFYFKNGKILNISSNYGKYNNKTLDMLFRNDVRASYDGSKLYANKAEYNNSQGNLVISNNVKVTDIKGTVLADKVVFDINENKLNISANENKMINAILNYK